MKEFTPRSMMSPFKVAALAAALFVTFGASQHAQAAAFQLPTTNAAGFGRGFAGGSLWANDPSASYNNPAAMAWFTGAVVQGSWIGIRPDIQFNGTATDASGRPMSGNSPNGGDSFINDASAYYVQPISDRFALGFSFVAPYGLVTQYSPSWLGREFGTKTTMKSIALSMSASYKVQDDFAIGVGVTAQRTRAQLNNGLDVGGILTSIPALTGGAPQDPLENAQVNVRVHNWSAGYFLGAEWKPSENDSLAISYHSKISNRLHGQYAMYYPNDGKPGTNGGPTIDVRDMVALIPGLNQLGQQFIPGFQPLPALNPDGSSASARLDNPAFANIDYLHQFSDSFSMGATVEWTNWSKFKTLALYSQGTQLLVLDTAYRNSYTVSVGGDYKFNSQWTGRAGLVYDETPTRSPTRDPRIPDNNRRIVALGLGYQYNSHLSFDAAYQHQFLSDARIHQTAPIGIGAGSIDGYSDNSGDVIALTATYAF